MLSSFEMVDGFAQIQFKDLFVTKWSRFLFLSSQSSNCKHQPTFLRFHNFHPFLRKDIHSMLCVRLWKHCSPLRANIPVSSFWNCDDWVPPQNVIPPWLSPMVSQWHNWQWYYFRQMSQANSHQDIQAEIIKQFFFKFPTLPLTFSLLSSEFPLIGLI